MCSRLTVVGMLKSWPPETLTTSQPVARVSASARKTPGSPAGEARRPGRDRVPFT
jgi:hypothetical protein